MKTGLITSDTYQNHNTGEGHPEKIDRVTAVIDNFKRLDNKNLIWKKPTKFDQSFLINTHSSEYIDLVSKSFPEYGLAFLDGDTVVSPGSKDATKDAVGSIITAIDGVQNKDLVWKKPSKFDPSLLEITHNPDYINFVEKSFPEKGLSFLDGDTIVSPGCKDATSDAVGSIITAIDGVQNKNFNNAFCAVRPPGPVSYTHLTLPTSDLV